MLGYGASSSLKTPVAASVDPLGMVLLKGRYAYGHACNCVCTVTAPANHRRLHVFRGIGGLGWAKAPLNPKQSFPKARSPQPPTPNRRQRILHGGRNLDDGMGLESPLDLQLVLLSLIDASEARDALEGSGCRFHNPKA